MSVGEWVRPPARQCVWLSRRCRSRIGRAFDDRTPSTECECADRCSFRLLLVENGRDQVLRHGLRMRWLHRIAGTALGEGADRGGVTEKLGQRNFRVNDGEMSARLDAVNAAAPTAQVAADVALR